ncbi:16827_t:CDS:2 [Acaulospora colombiana]|uniref:16827_t:CDS:1 n=1 Tax=Acaulospora colombiana TaxID=27376 RepID=A0ACA9LS28_9GLOM|nr:16827_t:CDS:2 [Acaulospora colombiana]
MHKLRRLRRRVAQADIHSEDEDEIETAREEVDLSDLTGSDASCEDSDIESENSHSDDEEVMKEQTNYSTEVLDSTEGTNPAVTEETRSLVEKTSTLIKDIDLNSTETKETRISSDHSKASDKENDINSTKESILNDSRSPEELVENRSEENEKHDIPKETSKVPADGQKKLSARQEYRKKLAEDPAFVPHLGEFWGHDDRFTKDELKNDFDPRPRNLPFGPKGRAVWANSPPKGRWGHDGFEELMRLDEEENHRKEFPRRVVQNRSSKFYNERQKSYREQSMEFASKKSFVTKFHDKNNGEDGGRPRDTGPSTPESKVQSEENTSRQRSHRGINSIRGRGYSRNHLRPHVNRVRTTHHSRGQKAGDVKVNNVEEDNRNLGDVDHHKVIEVENEPEHDETREADTVNENNITPNDVGLEEATPKIDITGETDVKDVRSENGVELGLSINEHEGVTEDSDEESEVEIILDPPSNNAIGKQETTNEKHESRSESSEKRSTDQQEKERSQPTTSSKRYSTRRVAATTAQNAQSSETEVNDGSSKATTTKGSEIPLSAVYAPPFKPKSVTLIEENVVGEEASDDNLPSLQVPETPIGYYTQARAPPMFTLRNYPAETPPPHIPFAAESNGMLWE